MVGWLMGRWSVVGWLDGLMVGWMIKCLDGWVRGYVDGWAIRQIDGWMVGWMDGWIVGWLDGCVKPTWVWQVSRIESVLGPIGTEYDLRGTTMEY